LTILNDILDISKLEAGKMELEIIDFDLVETVRSVVTLLSAQAQEKKIGLSLSMDTAGRMLFHGDPTRIRQVLLNLIGNAIKFTGSGGVELSVSIAGPAAGAGPAAPLPVRFVVSDTGIGMPAEVSSRIFENFSQADTSIARRYGGTGLGLAICRQLVEAMGGRIGVTSAPGVGSRFWFEIPLPPAGRQPQPAAAMRPEPPAPVPRETPRSRTLRVLLAEDNPINQKLMRAVLAKGGHSVEVAANGREALDAIGRQDFDLVLMDVRMPLMDGLEATRHIRALPPPKSRVTIIALTADAMSGAKAGYIKAGMDDYLSKPIDLPVLQAKIAEITDRLAATG
jgi:CheY-like chemotaxis protein